MGQGTRRGIQRCQECFPLRSIQPKNTPIRQCFVGTGKRALQNELAHGTIGCRRRGSQCCLSLPRQPEIQFFTTERTGWHIVTPSVSKLLRLPDNVKTIGNERRGSSAVSRPVVRQVQAFHDFLRDPVRSSQIFFPTPRRLTRAFSSDLVAVQQFRVVTEITEKPGELPKCTFRAV